MRSTSSISWDAQAWLRAGLGLGALLALAQAAGWVDAGRVVGALPDLCVFHRLTGWECPGCGMTRAFLRLLRGDWRGAWGFNPWSLPLLGLTLVAALLPRAALARALRSRALPGLGWAALAALLAWWLAVRILPHF
jgi:hypothetical protein